MISIIAGAGQAVRQQNATQQFPAPVNAIIRVRHKTLLNNYRAGQHRKAQNATQ